MRAKAASLAELASIVDGKPDATKIDEIDLEKLAREFLMQRIVFEAALDVYDEMQTKGRGGKPDLLGQLVRLIEQFMQWDGLTITPALFSRDGLRRRLILALNMTKLVRYIRDAIHFGNSESLEPVFDRDRPILSTGDMRT